MSDEDLLIAVLVLGGMIWWVGWGIERTIIDSTDRIIKAIGSIGEQD